MLLRFRFDIEVIAAAVVVVVVVVSDVVVVIISVRVLWPELGGGLKRSDDN